jgi:manganese transport protein
MEGFVEIRLPSWLRRMATRGVAIVPAVIVAWFYGASGTTRLLILSQIILSLQLPFAVVPLVQFTSSKALMGGFANGRTLTAVAWLVTALIIGLNATLLVSML